MYSIFLFLLFSETYNYIILLQSLKQLQLADRKLMELNKLPQSVVMYIVEPHLHVNMISYMYKSLSESTTIAIFVMYCG